MQNGGAPGVVIDVGHTANTNETVQQYLHRQSEALEQELQGMIVCNVILHNDVVLLRSLAPRTVGIPMARLVGRTDAALPFVDFLEDRQIDETDTVLEHARAIIEEQTGLGFGQLRTSGPGAIHTAIALDGDLDVDSKWLRVSLLWEQLGEESGEPSTSMLAENAYWISEEEVPALSDGSFVLGTKVDVLSAFELRDTV